MSKRKICVITGSRAEYGHLFWLMRSIAADKTLRLQVAVTGMHLSSRFGLTYKVIKQDGFTIDAKVPILHYGNSPVGIAKAIGRGCASFSDHLQRLRPDLLVICGDRYEMLAAAIAAHVLGIPIAHLHGGENSEGAVDEAFRHAITKMSYIHFAATESYRKRIIQLGENPKYVYNFGAPGLDHLCHQSFLTREALADALGFDLSRPTAIVTFHPVTLERTAPVQQVREMLKAIDHAGIKAVFTKSNADAGGEAINRLIKDFCRKDPQRYYFTDNLGSRLYLSCLKRLDVMVGNSSSGVVESASFKLPVVNIGDRQKGRLRPANIIDVPCRYSDICRGIRKALTPQFRRSIDRLHNPYARLKAGTISPRIKDVLRKIDLRPEVLKKSFYNMSF